MQANEHPPHWHSLSASDTLARLKAPREGLSAKALIRSNHAPSRRT